MQTNYIKFFSTPHKQKPQGRRAWSIDLETEWLPFFTATSTTGEYVVPPEAIGAPIRLGYNKDGSVRFSPNGRPVTRVAKPISDGVQMMREDLVARMRAYREAVIKNDADGYKAQIEMARKAGEPINASDAKHLSDAIAEQMAAAAEAEAANAPPAVAVAAAPVTVADAPPAENVGEAETVPDKERELVLA